MHFTDEQPFLDAVFDRYADDRPRLVYADFLDDSGEPERAELIRVQLALARLGEDDPRRPALSDRQAELLARNRADWTAHLAGLVVSVDFRRGIPDSASVDAVTFLERGAELFTRLRVRRLRLLDAGPVLAKLAVSPLLANVRELDLCSAELGNNGLAQLVKSPHLKRLDALDLGFNALDDGGVEALARSYTLPALTHLALNDNDRITFAGLRALAESPFFAGLTALDVSGNDISETGIQAVVASRAMARLRTFRVNNNPIGDGGIAALAGSPLVGRVLKTDPRLDLRAGAIGPAGAGALAACPALAGCTALDLSDNYLGDVGLAAFLRSPHIGRLKVLKLGRNQLTDAGIAAVYEPLDALLDRLQTLDLSGNRLTRVGLSILSTLRADRPVRIDVGGNVQAPNAGDAPVAVSGLIDNVVEAARLKRLVANPRHRTDGT
ncbi:MAG: TIGR02996 domain-containing protein [Planctomycetes bacterium]|nr:TIGR02996 domain-containing protein [Planctomycetota bacterium]